MRIVASVLIGSSLAFVFFLLANTLQGELSEDQYSRSRVAHTAREVVQSVGSALGVIEDTCHKPFHYTIGTVDPRFEISRDDVKAALQKAATIWETASGEDLLQYDEQADFAINLIFDERQQRTIDTKRLQKELGSVQTLQEGISRSYDTLFTTYNKQKSRYEDDIATYKRLGDAYQQQVKYWNAKGGAPSEEYNQLQKQQKNLESLANALEKQRKKVNALVQQMNALAQKESKALSGYNALASTYESVYGDAKEFDQGVYTGKEINIYQFEDETQLVLVLSHEFGHALGMNHVENPASIMYYLMDQQEVRQIIPSSEDRTALATRCQ